jgi:hypothetical protein
MSDKAALLYMSYEPLQRLQDGTYPGVRLAVELCARFTTRAADSLVALLAISHAGARTHCMQATAIAVA